MSMLDLSSWAALAEVVATVAVVLSLLLVAYSIKRNTDEMETSNSNFLYQLDAQIAGDLSRDVRLATMFLKMEQKETLTDVEKFQYVTVQERYLGLLEIAWTQYKSGSLAFIDWCDWDKYLSDTVTDGLPKEWWIEIRSKYKPEFAEQRRQQIRRKLASHTDPHLAHVDEFIHRDSLLNSSRNTLN